MVESLIRELMRQQDTLFTLIPEELWHKYTEINEEIIDYLNKLLT